MQHADHSPTLKQHFWFGRWIDDQQLDAELALPPGSRPGALATRLDERLQRPFPFESLTAACASLSRELAAQGPAWEQLYESVRNGIAASEAEAMLDALTVMLQPDQLQAKLRGELGTMRPGVLERRYPGRQYEAWMPAGCVVHVMPTNVLLVGALGLLESLLAGNLNIVKLSGRDTAFAALFAQALARHDPSDSLSGYMAVLRLASSRQAALRTLFRHADVISAWGGETAVAAVRKLAPPQAKLVVWGHKVSFGYLAAECLDDEQALEGFARDVCRLDQQACSSPQTLLVEAEGEALERVAERLAAALGRVSPGIPAQAPDMAEQAELTTVLCVARAEQALGLARVIEAPDHAWRVLVDHRAGLKPSPLFRTIWVKPVQRDQLGPALRPMRPWLQTCGLACALPSVAALSRMLLASGVTRIARPGEMTDSYGGAPHDGVYALQQLTRRVSVDGPATLAQVGSFAELESLPAPVLPAGMPILSKAGFQALGVQPDSQPGLVVRSGGSSGQTVYSRFRWPDYHRQMQVTAHGLVAAGLEPATDRVMNLFAAGYMYGSFISFWTILEQLGATQLPMAMVPEYELIAEQIIAHKVNAVIGMTPHLLGLMQSQGERLREAGCLRKLFFGGESLSAAQREFLQRDCGIELVRSVAYGSNDAGPMGYQCGHCEGSVHHLFSSLQQLEIVHADEDRPVAGTEVGRLLLSSRARAWPSVQRYEIGDLGRWVPGPCGCGRADPRFELAGRTGDVFKAGTPQLNHAEFVRLVSQGFGYAGPLQIHLSPDGSNTRMSVWLDESLQCEPPQVVDYLVANYGELQAIDAYGLAATLHVERRPIADFERVKASGKYRHVCDHRVAAVPSASARA